MILPSLHSLSYSHPAVITVAEMKAFRNAGAGLHCESQLMRGHLLWVMFKTCTKQKDLMFFFANFPNPFRGDLVFSFIMVKVSESSRFACGGNNLVCKITAVCYTEGQFDQVSCFDVKTECQAFVMSLF